MSSLVIQSFSNLHTCRRSSLSVSVSSTAAAAPPFARLVNSPTKCVPRYVLLPFVWHVSCGGGGNLNLNVFIFVGAKW